ncbi:MAG: hypothetical protein ABIL02_02670 [candidate division WOR-3 bacterium]
MGEEKFVLLTKLQIPEVNPRTLYRDRLIRLLYQNMHKKLIFICAGAGYGKTTLITQFINATKVPYVYYQLRKEDGDPSIFLSHLIAGIENIHPDFGKNLYKLSQFFNLPSGMTGIVLGTFINEILKTINNDTYLIFDDYHTLESPSTIDDIISFFLQNMPKKLHIILSSRSNLPLSFTQLKSKDEMFEMNTELFRFTKEEIQALFQSIFNLKLNPSQIEWLYEHSEGWPACLGLMLQSYETVSNINIDSFFAKLQKNYEKITEDIFDYFALEIFKNEKTEHQQFLIDCALLDNLNQEICTAVTGRDDCQKILEELVQKNAFVFSLADGNYRFHSLYQEFLKSRFINEDRKKEIYNLIAEYYKKYNYEEVLKYYLLAENWTAAIKIIEGVGKDMLKQGKYTTIVSSVEKIPIDLLNKNPRVLKYYGDALGYLGNQEKAKEILNKALKLSKNLEELKSEIMYSLSGVLINEGNLNLAIKYLTKLIKKCPKRLNLLRASALNSLGAINNAIGGKRLYQAKKLFKEAFIIAEKHNFQELKTSVLNNWAMNEFKLGNLENAYEKIIPAIDLLKGHFSLGCGAAFYNGARISLLLGHKEIAENILENGSNICKIFNDPWSTANIHRGYGLLYIEKDDLKKAKEFFLKALEFYEQIKIPWLIVTTLIELCKIEIKKENLTEAEKIFDRIRKLMKGTDSEKIHIMYTETLLKIAKEQYGEAEIIANDGIKLSKKYNLPLERFFIQVKLCSVFQRLNKVLEAVRLLKKLINMAERMGYDYLLVKLLKEEPGLVDLMVKYKVKTSYLYSCLKKYRVFSVLKVSFFGIPTLEINGERIQDGEWKTEKAKKLFFYLLFNKNKDLAQDKLIETFWHKAGLKKGYDSLRKAVYYIRKALKNYGVEEPILVRTGYYQLTPHLFVYSDIDEIDSLVEEYKTKGRLSEKQYRRFLNIYKEGFARTWYDNWVIEMDDKYKIMFEKISKLSQ